jgi:Restriction endonuclease
VPRQRSEDKDYELLTQAVYQTILVKEGYRNIDVQHDVDLQGRSGATHQVDVYWHFKQAGLEHKVLVECKNYSTKISLGKIRDFHSVIQDLGPCQGIMVTKTGYQSGVRTYARSNAIGLKLLRAPAERLSAGIRVEIHWHLRTLSTKHKIKITPIVSKPRDQAQADRLRALHAAGDVSFPELADLVLFDGDGNAKTGRFADWLQRNLTIQGREIGGPYTERITPADYYYPINQGKPNQELVPLDGVDVEFWVDGTDETIAHHAHQLVEAILRDEFSGEVEHIHRRQPPIRPNG